MASSGDFELDNEDGFDPESMEHNRTGMNEKMKTFCKRAGADDKKKAGVLPAKKGEWILFTRDFSKKVRHERAQWIVCPHAPGSQGESDLKECIEEALFAMKCLLHGKMYVPNLDRENADVFTDLEPFLYTLGLKQKAAGNTVTKKNKPAPNKGVPSFVLINGGDVLIGCFTMDDSVVASDQRFQWAQSKEAIKKCFDGLKSDFCITFDGTQNISAKVVMDKIEGHGKKLAV